jgi:mannose-6-phosphate isomerase-like protein (cupin superfamily)
MGNKVREFMTHREPDEHIWVERDEDALIGTVRAGQRPMPRIRVFDLLQNEAAVSGQSQVLVWDGETLRIAAEQVKGKERGLTRAADYDIVFVQFSGSSAIESEYGAVELEPGEIALIPAGIAHRSTAKGECLRLRVMSKETVNLGVDPEKPLSESRFKVVHSDPLPSQNGAGPATADDGRGLEHVSFWDPASDIWIERKCADLIGSVKEGGRGLKKLRAFDYFTGMTGKGGAKAPVLYTGNEFRIDVYNLEGQQRGFHRGLDEDEIWFQFRGHAVNDTEWGIVELDPGEMTYVPRGIAHRINGGKGFLRMVFYTRHLIHPKAFNSSAGRQTSFFVE